MKGYRAKTSALYLLSCVSAYAAKDAGYRNLSQDKFVEQHPEKEEQTMADMKTASAQSATTRVKAEIAADDLSAQVVALREDLARLSESVVALGQSAKTAVADEASVMTERLRERIREEPIFAVAVTAGVAYLFGLMSRR
nr:hypothetical protein [Rhizobium mesoamericanum]